VVGGATAAAVALGGNLGGVTSFLLSLDGGVLAGRLKLDVLVPVRGLKRCVDAQNGFGRPLGRSLATASCCAGLCVGLSLVQPLCGRVGVDSRRGWGMLLPASVCTPILFSRTFC
jgi:hypothetical protein